MLPASSNSQTLTQINKYVTTTIAELLHHARLKSMYSDVDLDNAAKMVIQSLTPIQLAAAGDIVGNKKKLKREDGYIGHTLVNTFCRYSQTEIDTGKEGN